MGRRSAANQIDWEAIQKEFRLGQKSLRQMATEFGVQASAISRKAAKDGWVQDKSEEVRALSEAKLLLNNAKATPTRLEIEAAAEIRTNAVLNHRAGLQRLRIVKDKLLAHVESVVDNLDDMGDVVALLRQDTAEGLDKAGDKMAKAMDRSILIDDVKKLAEIDERVRKGEREAFGIGSDADAAKSSVDDVLRRIMGHAG